MPSNIFAKLEAIKGESLDSKHKDEIDVLSFSWGLVNTAPPAGGGGGTSGKPTFLDIAFVHNIDRASPLHRAGAGRLLQQPGDRLQVDGPAGSGHRGVPARHCHRPRPRQRA